MATLTYDPTEPQESEFTKEEQEAIKVGESLEEQQNELLAGKFKDAETLEKAYVELQKKLGSSEEKTEEEEEEVTEAKEEVEEVKEEEEKSEEVDSSFLDTLWEEASSEKFTKETISKLQKLAPEEIAKMHLDYRANVPPKQDLTAEDVTKLQGLVGGEKEYDSMMQWAGENLEKEEVSMYDTLMDRGDPLSCFFAVQSLAYRYNDSRGVDGKMITGKAPVNKADVFRSQAEVVRAMSDSKYDTDPAYRQDIYDKLERSNINF